MTKGLWAIALLFTLFGCSGSDNSAGNKKSGRKMPPRLQGAYESKIKADLMELRTALTLYNQDYGAGYPEKLNTLFEGPGARAEKIPSIKLLDHKRSNKIVHYGAEICPEGPLDSGQLKDTGQWGYVGDKDSSCWGLVFIDCSHKDSRGIKWHNR